MEKLDHKKVYASLYKATAGKPNLVNAPVLNYLMIDGYGDPNTSPLFNSSIEALYSLSYTLKFMVKKGEMQIDYAVMPLEGLWWADDMANFSNRRKDEWKWTLMIMQPDFITAQMVDEARSLASAKKELPRLADVRFETMEDGLSAQVLHVGPFDEELPTIELLHHYIAANEYQLSGKHREIYLSDMRRTAKDKLKTIIRQPVLKS
jgi:hypothetical protein